MGISGLLPLLKEIHEPRNIADFKGKRLAVDAYVWLHKGAFGCAEDLVKGNKTTRFVDYAMYRVRMLRYHNITPFVVFDGGPLPAKRGTEDSRAKSRADHLARARAFEAQGRLKDARDCYTKCLDVTPEMAYQLIKALRAEGVDYVVAPYEADAQLCFLEREGFVDGIITEDSDLLVFGCKTVIFKLEKDGSCMSIDRSRLATVRELPMHGWTDVQFRRMAMLSGCDYLPSIPGIGLKKAHRMLRRYKTVEKMIQAIRLEGSHDVPNGYLADFAQAELAFIYQRVFCPEQRRLVPLTQFPAEGLHPDDEKWVGLDVDVETARGMAAGDIHPESRKAIADLWPDFRPANKGARPVGITGSGAGRGGTGTLDAFFTRVKRTKSTPAIHHQPVGKMASGPTRMSDLPNGISRHSSDPGLTPPREIKQSKFFAPAQKRALTPEPEPEPKFELQWEATQDVESQPRGERRSASPEHIRSPSPFASSVEPTPRKALTRTMGTDHFTSPVSVFSGVSSPPRSSPATVVPHKGRGRGDEDLDLDRDQDVEDDEPSSPTPRRILVAASSQAIATLATAGSSPRISDSDSLSGRTRTTHQRPNTGTTRKTKTRPLTRITDILVPASSPAILDARGVSSDSIAEDEIVTPSPILDGGGGGAGMAKRRRVEHARDVSAVKDKYKYGKCAKDAKDAVKDAATDKDAVKNSQPAFNVTRKDILNIPDSDEVMVSDAPGPEASDDYIILDHTHSSHDQNHDSHDHNDTDAHHDASPSPTPSPLTSPARAKAVSQGWRAKYALDSPFLSSPAAPRKRTSAALPLSATAHRMLSVQSVNLLRAGTGEVQRSGSGSARPRALGSRVGDDGRGVAEVQGQGSGHGHGPENGHGHGQKQTHGQGRGQAGQAQGQAHRQVHQQGHAQAPAQGKTKVADADRTVAVSVQAKEAKQAKTANPHGLTWAALERFRFAR